MMDSQESLFVQWLAAEKHPEAGYVMSGFHAGPGRQTFGRNWRAKADCALSYAEGNSSVLHFYNFHGIYYHNFGRHRPGCETGGGAENEHLTLTERDDIEKSDYASAMSAAAEKAGLKLRFRYSSVYECELFHKNSFTTSRGESVYKNVRDLLISEHDAVVGLGSDRFTQEALLQKILESGDNGAGNDFGGFVVVCGGRETREDQASKSMAFCHQRCSVTPAELGRFTRYQALERFGGRKKEAEEFVSRMSARKQTLTKRSFHRGGETVGLDYFRFLLRERGLAEFEIRHLLFYKHKRYLSPFIDSFLQRRHDLRADPNSGLERNLLKLVLNGIYGFCSVESKNFPVTKVRTESTYRRSKKARDELSSKELIQFTLLGAARKEAEKPPELVYAQTMHAPNARTFNVCQISACILSQSRKVFLSKILAILNLCDPKKVELSYVGKREIRRIEKLKLKKLSSS